MDIFIRANTVYDFHVFGTNSLAGRTYIINSIEQAIDATDSFSCDLFLPNCFINGRKNSDFWFRMAAMACSDRGVNNWHELEYGLPINRYDLRQRYVYTWTSKGDVYRFYTKVLTDGCYPELIWYVGKAVGETRNMRMGSNDSSGDDMDSSYDTDTEEISLYSAR